MKHRFGCALIATLLLSACSTTGTLDPILPAVEKQWPSPSPPPTFEPPANPGQALRSAIEEAGIESVSQAQIDPWAISYTSYYHRYTHFYDSDRHQERSGDYKIRGTLPPEELGIETMATALDALNCATHSHGSVEVFPGGAIVQEVLCTNAQGVVSQHEILVDQQPPASFVGITADTLVQAIAESQKIHGQRLSSVIVERREAGS